MITLDDIQGHWRRDWIKAPGFEDTSTRVHWMQSGAHYADVRVPLDRPDLTGVTALCDLSPETLAVLLKAEGFAGTVTLDGDRCTWAREVNWHGTPEGKDIGHIAFDAQGRMIESGVEADYTELWCLRSDPDHHVTRLSGQGFEGVLVTIGNRFVLGIDQPDRPSTKPVLEALLDGDMPVEVGPLFDALYATGIWDNGKAIAELATQPLCEGKSVLTLSREAAIWYRTDFRGKQDEIPLIAVNE